VARVRAGTSDDGRGPVWSPDGRRLAFAVQGPGIADQGGVSASGELDLVASAADGSKRLTLTTAPGSEFAPSWSPDGKSILYEGTAPNTPGPNGAWLRLVPAAGGPSTTIVRLGEAGGAAWSPDGRWIAFVAWLPRESRARLYVVRPNGAGLRRLTGEVLPRTPAWSPDGTTIAYAAYGGTIETIRPDGSGHATVASLPGAEIDSLAWSPTGKTIAFDARKTPPES
jgi:TolB protein